MKTSMAIALSLSLLVLAGCSDGNSKFKGQFLAGCVGSGASESYCSCAFEKLEVQYSPDELSKWDKTGVPPKGFERFVNATKEVCLLQTH